jgi:hypothetical protein
MIFKMGNENFLSLVISRFREIYKVDRRQKRTIEFCIEFDCLSFRMSIIKGERGLS